MDSLSALSPHLCWLAACRYDTREGGELYNKLVENPRVIASAGGFTYRSEHGIMDKATLLRFIRSNPEGVRASDIKDGYE